MSLATRCTACGTVFRVVQDQLKVSEGWVRCGRCSEVFNALEGLFDLERDAPPQGSAGAVEAGEVPTAETGVEPDSSGDTPDGSAPVEADPTAVETTASTDAIDKLDAQLLRARESGHDSTPATRVSERDRLEFPDAQFDPEMLADDTLDAQPPGAEPVPAQPLAATEPPSTPSFVQHAQRNARWNTPGMRALQGVVAVVLVAALGLQVAHRFRDLIAARWPGTGPALAAWCGSAGCTIDAPRRIEDVAVESTALARASSVPDDAFRLSVVLRNRGAMTVALPSVDLSLTDANGQLVSRRMLAPRDFGVASTSMRAGAEAALQLVLSTSGARVTGYTVEVFYP